jgi:hypothetical protein
MIPGGKRRTRGGLVLVSYWCLSVLFPYCESAVLSRIIFPEVSQVDTGADNPEPLPSPVSERAL